jgi:hypothetical protein
MIKIAKRKGDYPLIASKLNHSAMNCAYDKLVLYTKTLIVAIKYKKIKNGESNMGSTEPLEIERMIQALNFFLNKEPSKSMSKMKLL